MSERRGVSAAEKYAELLALGQERPLCVCHQETMRWHKGADLSDGGRWVCVPSRSAEKRRYREAHHDRVIDYGRLYYQANADRLSESSRHYYHTNVETLRQESFERYRHKAGIPVDHPVMSSREKGLRGSRIRMLRNTVSDQHAMNVIERMDSRQAQLMRLAVNEGASPYERRRALEKLDQHLATKLKGSDPAWQHSKITSEGTRTPQPLPRSTYC